MRTTVLKIYGERNTGTRYLAKLFDSNLEAPLLRGVVPPGVARLSAAAERAQRLVGGRPHERIKDLYFASTFGNNLGWKHMLVSTDRLSTQELAGRAVFVALTKNPYSWLLSMFREPYHSTSGPAGDFLTFVRTPWETVGREGARKTYDSPIHLWNEKNAAYLTLADHFPTINVLYEDLVSDPARVVDRVGSAANGWARTSAFQNVNESTKGDRSADFAYYRDYYLSEKWIQEMTQDSIDYIAESVDREVVEGFGYQIM